MFCQNMGDKLLQQRMSMCFKQNWIEMPWTLKQCCNKFIDREQVEHRSPVQVMQSQDRREDNKMTKDLTIQNQNISKCKEQ